MHRSRLTTIVIDCNESTLASGADFWSQALGMRLDPNDEPADRYKSLVGGPAGTRLLLQQVPTESAIHLDIETDDVEAEVRRLEALGATRKYRVKSWWVMRAPTGHDFCVVRPQSSDFPGDANVWE